MATSNTLLVVGCTLTVLLVGTSSAQTQLSCMEEWLVAVLGTSRATAEFYARKLGQFQMTVEKLTKIPSSSMGTFISDRTHASRVYQCAKGNDSCPLRPCQSGGECRRMSQTHVYACQGASCSPNPCQNGGLCSVSGSPSAIQCECQPGYTGPRCQTRMVINFCESRPCLNGGACSSLPYSYRCTCPNRYSGQRCQVYTAPTTRPVYTSPTRPPVYTTTPPPSDMDGLRTAVGQLSEMVNGVSKRVQRMESSSTPSNEALLVRITNLESSQQSLQRRVSQLESGQAALRQELARLKTELRPTTELRPATTEQADVATTPQVVESQTTAAQPVTLPNTPRPMSYIQRMGTMGWTMDLTRPNSCFYKYFMAQKTFNEARSYCQSATAFPGGDLVTIKDEQTCQFLKSRIRENYWIGATDIAVEGQWRWVDNSLVTYSKWDVTNGAPNNNPPGEDCAAALMARDGRWEDFFCNIQMSFVCEFCPQ